MVEKREVLSKMSRRPWVWASVAMLVVGVGMGLVPTALVFSG